MRFAATGPLVGKIWLDVTTILGWQRPAVGIVRVELECARFALSDLSSTVEFCRYDPSRGYLPVAPSVVQEAIERISRGHGAAASADAKQAVMVPGNKLPAELRLGSLARRLMNRLPRRLRDPAFLYLSAKRDSAYAAIGAIRELRRAWKLLGSNSSVRNRPQFTGRFVQSGIRFSKGDVYISLGLDWDQKDMSFIYHIKMEIGFKVLSCCYDLIPVKFPHLCVGDVAARFALYFTDLAWSSDEIVCISERSRADLLELLTEVGAPIPAATVFKLGSELALPDGHAVTDETRSAAGDRFVLFVSTIERRKNHETLYRAYTRLVDQGETDLPKIVLVGMLGWGVADLLADLQFDPRIQGRIEILSNVGDADLSWLYRNALFTVFPSLYEGWGLPVAESLAAGKFCLASDRGSIPEVGGDLVEYIDPWDVPRWAQRLKWYFDNPDAVSGAERRIREEYDSNTWRSSASFVFDRAQKLLSK
ncbi:MAG: glycosyltransferase family 4 protein [Rhizobiales bacterium]|nr:glycosyltransferase family 4 protein [Hyphomicrobiales bacterium]